MSRHPISRCTMCLPVERCSMLSLRRHPRQCTLSSLLACLQTPLDSSIISPLCGVFTIEVNRFKLLDALCSSTGLHGSGTNVDVVAALIALHCVEGSSQYEPDTGIDGRVMV